MATPGYEPYSVPWHAFFGGIAGLNGLNEEQTKQIKHIVGVVTEHRMHPEGTSYLDRFRFLMRDQGRAFNREESDPDLVNGLLACLDDYQSYSPYTRLDSVQAKLGGIYDHFKGGIYLIRDFSSWASGRGELVVEYLSMLFGTKHSRIGSEWCEVVQWPDGKYRSRFVYR